MGSGSSGEMMVSSSGIMRPETLCDNGCGRVGAVIANDCGMLLCPACAERHICPQDDDDLNCGGPELDENVFGESWEDDDDDDGWRPPTSAEQIAAWNQRVAEAWNLPAKGGGDGQAAARE